MTVRMQTSRKHCLDEAELVDYVYDESDEKTKDDAAAHIASCAVCAEDVRALLATREELKAWSPPDASLGFQVVASPSSTVLRPARWWRQPLPAWAQVAAAVVLFSAGAALGMLRGTDIVTNVGSYVAPGRSPAVGAATTAPDAAHVSVRDLAALEQRLRAEMAQQGGTQESSVASATRPDNSATRQDNSATRPDNSALLEQVRTLIRESEHRQQQELTLRTAELVKDVDAQRRGDLARIERTFGQMEGTTGVQVEQQRQLLNYLMRVSQRQPQ